MADGAPAVGPSQAALAVPERRSPATLIFGVPVTLDDFMERFDAAPANRSDFLSKFDNFALEARERSADRLRWWSSRYEPNVARPLLKLAGDAAALGCAVRQRATLRDLVAAASEDAVVIVVSHWKGPEFSNDDFLPDFGKRLTARLEGVDHPLAAAILRSMRPKRSWFARVWSSPLNVREALRQSLDAPLRDRKTAGDIYYELDATRRARRRDLLDGWLHGLIRPGNRLELFDGLHAADQISRAIASDFAGVLDLTVCTSTYLGDRLGHAAEQRFRTVQFLELQDFFEASIRIGLVLNLFAKSALSYIEARAAVSRAYTHTVEDIGHSIGRRGGPSNGQASRGLA